MGLKKIIKEIFSPISEPQKETPVKKEPDDAFQYVDEVVGNLSAQLRKFYAGRRNELTGETLYIWVVDDNKRKLLGQCHDRLLTSLRDDCGMPVADVAMKGGPIPTNATEFYDGYAFTVGESTPLTGNDGEKATITIHNGKGSLLKPEYSLTANGGRYNIGRDAKGENSIGIVGNPGDPNYELNKYVRSRHVNIAFVGGVGFCLFVEYDGTRVFGNSRTQLLRNGDVLELDNPKQAVPLRDGDVIVLGKSVELEWKTK